MKLFVKNIFFLFILLNIIIYCSSRDGEGKIGAYIKTPDPRNLEFRLGNGLGYYGNGWGDDRMSILSAKAGYNGQRKKLPEQHFVNWGYGIEVGDCQVNKQYGILDLVGFLATPAKDHSTCPSNQENCMPKNLYEDIWLKNGTVNPNNYWAYYVNETVTRYKDYVKIWETWNEPDYTNWQNAEDWANNPPKKDDLYHWHGTIFEYIRLIRITYEVAKTVDPSCWVTAGGLGYDNFLDAVLRYIDNPKDGSVTSDYPALGGAYFDADAYHQYPKYGSYDPETGESFNYFGSDSLAKKVVALKKSHHHVIKKYGFGTTYPDKIFVNTETGVTSTLQDGLGGDLVRRNWILKLGMYSIEYDVRQIHILNLVDNNGYGDFNELGNYKSSESIEEAFNTKMKSSSKGRLTLKKINLGKFIFSKKKTKELRESLSQLPNNITGIVLKRKFPKLENETNYAEYIYSLWLYCEKEEISNTVQYQLIHLNLNSNPLYIDWLQNEKQISKSGNVEISSTPIFLLSNDTDVKDNDYDYGNISNYDDKFNYSFGYKEKNGKDEGKDGKDGDEKDGDEKDDGGKGGTSGFVIFLKVTGIILLILVVLIVLFYLYRRYTKNKEISLGNNNLSPLLKDNNS